MKTKTIERPLWRVTFAPAPHARKQSMDIHIIADTAEQAIAAACEWYKKVEAGGEGSGFPEGPYVNSVEMLAESVEEMLAGPSSREDREAAFFPMRSILKSVNSAVINRNRRRISYEYCTGDFSGTPLDFILDILRGKVPPPKGLGPVGIKFLEDHIEEITSKYNEIQ